MSAGADSPKQYTLEYSDGIVWTIASYEYSEARLHQLTTAYWSQHARIRFLRELAPNSTVIEFCADHESLAPALGAYLPDRGDIEIVSGNVALADLDSADSRLSPAGPPRLFDAAALVRCPNLIDALPRLLPRLAAQLKPGARLLVELFSWHVPYMPTYEGLIAKGIPLSYTSFRPPGSGLSYSPLAVVEACEAAGFRHVHAGYVTARNLEDELLAYAIHYRKEEPALYALSSKLMLSYAIEMRWPEPLDLGFARWFAPPHLFAGWAKPELDLLLGDRDRAANRTAAFLDANVAGRLDDLIGRVGSLQQDMARLGDQALTTDRRLRHADAKLADIRRRVATARDVIRVVFCVYFRRYWSSLEPIYKAMRADPGFAPTVVVVRDYGTGGIAEDKAELRRHLIERGVAFLDWDGMDSDDNPSNRLLLDHFAPDVVFTQTHWDLVPPPFRAENLAAYRPCYIPYGLDLVVEVGVARSHELHHSAWRIFVPSQGHVEFYRNHALNAGVNVVAVGHPRLDEIAEAARRSAAQRGTQAGRPFRLLWAPHHSVGGDWLNFGTFPHVCNDVIAYAQAHADVLVCLRVHHILYAILRNDKIMTQEEIDEFLRIWNGLPNTSLDEDPSYVGSFAWADALLTDGLSFLAEFQLTEKPLVFLERADHVPFSSVGEMVVQGCYREPTIAAALQRVDDLRSGADDPLRETRRKVAQALTPFPGRAALRILEEIKQGLARET